MKRGVYVDGVTETSVSSAKDAYQVLSTGWVNRKVASTSMNRESSRSHAVFTLSIESKKRVSLQLVKFDSAINDLSVVSLNKPLVAGAKNFCEFFL